MLDLKTIRANFNYCFKTGALVRLTGRASGKVAGNLDTYGHRQIKFQGKLYLAHRLIWLLVTGKNPIGEIDHINGNKDDNRFSNLREATRSQNMANISPRGAFKGTTFHKGSGKWTARIRTPEKRYFLGYFNSQEQAHEAYKAAAAKYHGEFARIA